MKRTRSSVCLLLLATLGLQLDEGCTRPSLQPSPQPNIVFFLVDDLGWTHISAAGPNHGNASGYYETPHIETMAAEGMSFTSAYAAHVCSPSRAAFQTGQSSPRTGMYRLIGNYSRPALPIVGVPNAWEIPASSTTIAETLRSAGYRTAHVGKWHIGPTASITRDHGYDFNLGGNADGQVRDYFAFFASGKWKFNRVGPGIAEYAAPYTQDYVDTRILPFSNGTPIAEIDGLVGSPKHLTDALTDAAIDFMDRERMNGTPFFLDLCHFAVHPPFDTPRPDLLAKYENKSSTDPRHHDPRYGALIEGVDQSLGRILEFLRNPDADDRTPDSIAETTLVVFYSDNGGSHETNNSPLKSEKGTFYEGGIRVPMIAWQPGTIRAGSVNDSIISMVDHYPTFAELAGAPLPPPNLHEIDGISYADSLRGSSERDSRAAHYLHVPDDGDAPDSPSVSLVIRSVEDHYKLIYFYADPDRDYSQYDGGHYELYNLTSDPGEEIDLMKSPHSSKTMHVAAKLSKDLRRWLGTVGAAYPTIRDPLTGLDTGVQVSPPFAIELP